MTRLPIFLLFVIAVFFMSGCSSPKDKERAATASEMLNATAPKPLPANETDFSLQESEWLHFRSAFPLHMQTLAVSAPYPAGTRTLIISEPPPHVKLAQLIEVDPARLASNRTKQWTIGYDGWVKDIVVALPPMTDVELAELVRGLSNYLYFTDYKAFALDLPVDTDELATKYPLDIQATTSDLERWYNEQLFTEANGTNENNLRQADFGVYYSKEPGLIVWVLPKSSLEQHKALVRQFALDSDLILGAISREDKVVLFGRERSTPVTVMPPLRTEMILVLAATGNPSLSQSYERTLWGAGSSHGRWDWAPIYLSPELLDTEYGSILNATDQMLKGWTQAGTCEYHNFPYPVPARYPFDAPLMRVLKADQLLFNWNTTGFGVVAESDGSSSYATSRTGALPVIYRPERGESEAGGLLAALFGGSTAGKVKRAEEQGYSYFATLNDPLLARAVQYATVYQAFKAFGVSALKEVPSPEWNQSVALKAIARDVLKALRGATDEEIDRAASAEAADIRERAIAAKEAGDQSLSDSDIRLLSDEARRGEGLRNIRREYIKFYDTYGDEGEEVLAAVLGQARDFDGSGLEDKLSTVESRIDLAFLIDRLKGGTSLLLHRLIGVRELQERFSRTRTNEEATWLRTPTVVFSRSLGSMALATGGHNLDSSVTKVKRTSSIERGTIRISEEDGIDGPKFREIECHPEDAFLVERNARLISRTDNPGNLKSRIERMLKEENSAYVSMAHSNQVAFLRSSESERGATKLQLGGSGGKGPPRDGNGPPSLSIEPPRPPGTPPSSGTPSSENGNRRDLNLKSVELLIIGENNGKATVRRDVNSNGAVETGRTEHWNRASLVNALGYEFEAGGRSQDRRPLRIVFESSISPDRAKKIVTDLQLHLHQRRSDRLIVLCRCEPTAFRTPVERVTMEKLPDVQNHGRGGVLIHGELTAKAGTEVSVGFEVTLIAAKVEVTADAVKISANRAVTKNLLLDEVAPSVIDGLRKDFRATGTSGVLFDIRNFGDLHLVEIEFPDGSLGVVAWSR